MNYKFLAIVIFFIIIIVVCVQFYISNEKFLIGNPTSQQLKQYIDTNIVSKYFSNNVFTIYAIVKYSENEKIKYLTSVSENNLPDDYETIEMNISSLELTCTSELADIVQIDKLIFYFKVIASEDEVSSEENKYSIISVKDTSCTDATTCKDYDNSRISNYISENNKTDNVVFSDYNTLKKFISDFNTDFSEINKKYTDFNTNFTKYETVINGINFDKLDADVAVLDESYSEFNKNLNNIHKYINDGDIQKVSPLITDTNNKLQKVLNIYNKLLDLNQNIDLFLNSLNSTISVLNKLKTASYAGNQLLENLKNSEIFQNINKLGSKEINIKGVTEDEQKYINNIKENMKNMITESVNKINKNNKKYTDILSSIEITLQKINAVDYNDTEMLKDAVKTYIDSLNSGGYVNNPFFGKDFKDINKNINLLNSIKDVISVGIDNTNISVNKLYTDLLNNNV